MCETVDEEFESTKDKIKAVREELKEGYSILKFLNNETDVVFKMPVKNNETYLYIFTDYIQYLIAIFDLSFHLVTVEIPYSEEKAYELACKIMVRCVELIGDKLKPLSLKMQTHLKKEKEPKQNLNYVQILHHLCVSIKWLSRGLSHQRDDEEKRELYSAIGEAKKTGQNCYDFFEDASKKHRPYYYDYVERWLDFIAKTYEYFENIAEKVDHMSMEHGYDGPLFAGQDLLEGKDKVEPYNVNNYSTFD
jgi:hypothetical protein